MPALQQSPWCSFTRSRWYHVSSTSFPLLHLIGSLHTALLFIRSEKFNLSPQWEDIFNAALFALQAESMRRLDNLITTIEKLLDMAGQEAPRIRLDLEKLEGLEHN